MSCCGSGSCDPAQTRRLGIGLLVFVLGLLAFQMFSKPKAATPAALDAGTTFNDAIAASATDGKVVLVVAHADWCGPCQSLKRGALSDPEVTQWLDANTHAVSLDVTTMDEKTPQWIKEAADALAISGIPAMVVLRDGKVVSRQVGAMSAGELLSWLKAEGAPSGVSNGTANGAANTPS